MIRLIINNIARFVVLVLIQVLILNHINLHNTINPFLYVLVIILLPLDTPIWALLFSGFFLGLTIDSFSGSFGIHAAATTLMAFSRPFVLRIVTPRGGYEHEQVPGMHVMGLRWFMAYSALLVFIHHFVLFNLEIFRLSEIFFTLLRIIASCLFTLLLILISQYVFKGRKK